MMKGKAAEPPSAFWVGGAPHLGCRGSLLPIYRGFKALKCFALNGFSDYYFWGGNNIGLCVGSFIDNA